MLSNEDKQRIREEEIYRAQVREEMRRSHSADTARKTLMFWIVLTAVTVLLYWVVRSH